MKLCMAQVLMTTMASQYIPQAWVMVMQCIFLILTPIYLVLRSGPLKRPADWEQSFIVLQQEKFYSRYLEKATPAGVSQPIFTLTIAALSSGRQPQKEYGQLREKK